MFRVPFRRLSFRVQIALTFGLIVIVLIAALSAVLGRMQAHTVRENAGHALQVVAHNAQRGLAEGLSRRLTIVRGLADSETLWKDGLASDAARTTFAQQQLVNTHLAWMGAADADGIVRSATRGLLVGVDVTKRTWFSAGLRGPYVGDVHEAVLLATLLPASRSGEPQRFVDFAAPVRVNGRLLGVLAMHGSWDWTRSLIESQLPEDAGALAIELFIFDRRGQVLYSPEEEKGNAPKGGRFEALVKAPGGTANVVRWPDGDDYLTATAVLRPRVPEADLGWVIAARMPKARADAPVRAAMIQVAALGTLAAVIATICAWFVSGSISKPLSAIERAAHDVTHGKVGAEIPDYGGNTELKGLSRALIQMTRGLETRVNEHSRLADLDPLTGLLNRRGFEQRMAAAIRRARIERWPLSVIAIDVDHFKLVNDRHGHDAGDRVLHLLANVLRTWFRDGDVVARMGGEEFTILLANTDLDGAQSVAERLVTHVSDTVFPGAGSITISCGVTRLQGPEDSENSLKRADLALYRAKSAGRNRSVTVAEELVD